MREAPLDPADFFRRRTIATMRADLFPELAVKFDKWAERHTLQEQLDFLTEDAMKRYVEPDILKSRVEVKDPMGLLKKG